MAIHKLSIDDFDEANYELIAIHTDLEDYRLAYRLNQKLPIILAKSKIEIQTQSKNGESFFPHFCHEDVENEICWDLIGNKSEILTERKRKTDDLFANDSQPIHNRSYFLPEFKKVDYFLKITNGTENLDELLPILNTIAKISTIYKVELDTIKSKNNLIF